MTRISILREDFPGERRVATTPEAIKKLIGLGATVAVEAGAGLGSSVSDEAYRDAGATVCSRQDAVANAGIILTVRGPDPSALAGLRAGAWIVGMLDPTGRAERIGSYAELGVTSLTMELMPRITRAQSMDVMSSQSNLVGYKAVLEAANEYGRAFPMMMTAAGTIAAARVFVMGVGVAGLQAIATARRLGAQVSATDVRPSTREQILSLGAKPVFVEQASATGLERSDGYASETSAEYREAQANLVSSHIARQDIVITSALVPGRAAPRLVTEPQIATMRPGSVIVDLATEQGGNVEGAVAGEVTKLHGVSIVGYSDMPSRLGADASALYARNVYNFLAAFWDKDGEGPLLPEGDEIINAICVTRGGKVVSDRVPVATGA